MIRYEHIFDEAIIEERFCTGKAHVLIQTWSAYEESEIPHGANANKYSSGAKTHWGIGLCDGSCQVEGKLPDPVAKALEEFQRDNKPREETFDGKFEKGFGTSLW